MNKQQLETKVYSLIEHAKRGTKIEDSTIELKACWPEGYAAARHLAGHANAARGEPILWVIGVDENNRTVVSVDQNEMANWLPAVANCFEGPIYPALRVHTTAHVDGVTVVAMLFETDNGPYIVRNPAFGSERTVIASEIPWREGNSTRTARRADLLRLLVPVSKLPSVEVLKSTMTWNMFNDGNERWSFSADLFLIPKGDTVFLPEHLWKGEFLYVYKNEWLPLKLAAGFVEQSQEGFVRKDLIKCSGPLRLTLNGDATRREHTQTFPDEVQVKLNLGIAGEDGLAIAVNIVMGDQSSKNTGELVWQIGGPKKTNGAFGVIRTRR